MKIKKNNNESEAEGFFMTFLASMLFAVPTAVLIWLGLNVSLAVWVGSEAHLSFSGFWFVLAPFIMVALISPSFFPAFMGRLWRFLLKIVQW